MKKNWKRHNSKLRSFEKRLCPKKYKIIAGVDEAGRGPLAGPVVASVVIPKEDVFINKIFDSKQISHSVRQQAFREIIAKAYVGVGIVEREEIDSRNILAATIIAIQKALDNLGVLPEYLLIDGKFTRHLFSVPYRTVIGGDRLCFSIACASIVAKVFRDNLMSVYSTLYPQYGFNRHQGYCTKEHLWAIKKYGLTPIHRRSFRPINML